ncbi:hypothetical protein [Synechococcus sp. CBW1006]|uniref:hypothetical protein n=1 Tax=Synechococcus sp. CBW1006 TaxID=1353138 RepID=UPI0018CE8F3B|nr:hypothetical protein [Synechococcus sp. CBW1006]QPN66976.1 hypothetical protein H8F26_01310 [Synechococcus sp. CBW1006]
MDSSISEFQDALSLKRDGRRVSLEGILTGSALGLFLVYTLKDTQIPLAQIDIGSSDEWLRTGEFEPIAIGKASGPVVAPADQLKTAGDSANQNPDLLNLSPLNLGSGISVQGGFAGANFFPSPLTQANLQSSTEDGLPAIGEFGATTSGRIGGSSGGGGSGGAVSLSASGLDTLNDFLLGNSSRNRSSDSTATNPLKPNQPSSPLFGQAPTSRGLDPNYFQPNELSASTTLINDRSFGNSDFNSSRPINVGLESPAEVLPPPKVLLVQVNTGTDAVASSVFDGASSTSQINQAALDGVTLDLRGSDIDQLVVVSSQQVNPVAKSTFTPVQLEILSSNIAALNSNLTGGADTDVFLIQASDLFNLVMEGTGGSSATASIQTIAMQASELVSNLQPTIVGAQATTGFEFFGLTDLHTTSLNFDLLTQAVADSTIRLGDWGDTVEIISTIGNADSTEIVLEHSGFLSPSSFLNSADAPQGVFNLNARAIGLSNSLLDTAGGNDNLFVSSHVHLDGSVSEGDQSKLAIGGQLQSIALLDSQILLGDGNDTAILDGAVVDSLIDLGNGFNQLVTGGSMLDSTIRSGAGTSLIDLANAENSLTLDSQGAVRLRGGNQSDNITLSSLPIIAEIDGQAGLDQATIDTPSGVELLVNGNNAAVVAGVTLTNIESIKLGNGDDSVVMSSTGSLDGSLDGGYGFDLLDFSNRSQSVVVDLDAGIASGIGNATPGALTNIEAVIGTNQSDQFAVSSKPGQYIDAGEGEDLIYLRWTPWTEADDTPSSEVLGGAGKDTFIVGSGFDTSPVNIFELPDIQFNMGINGTYGLSDRIRFGSTILTASDSSGIGDATLLPIAPLETLLMGADSYGSDFSQLAIDYSPLQSSSASMINLNRNSGLTRFSQIASLSRFNVSSSSSFESNFSFG